jgi:hypothetical protein
MVENVFSEPSLLVAFEGTGDVVREEITVALKETGWSWKVKDYVAINHYRDHKFSFNVADLEWAILVSVSESPAEEPNKVAYIRIILVMLEPDYRVFPVTFWPDKVRKSETSLGALVLSIVRGLTYIACDIDKFREFADLVRLSDDYNIVVYHDRMWLVRADVIMKREVVPYDFVVTYHFNFYEPSLFAIPKLSVRYSIVARGKAGFDVLAEAIIEEYWKEFIGGGGVK